MINKTIEKNNITWITGNSLTHEEIEKISEKFHLSHFLKNELVKPTIQPKINGFQDAIYLVLHFPIFNKHKNISKKQEIDFVIGKNFLLTVNYNEEFTPLIEFINKIEQKNSDNYFSGNAGMLFFHILQYFYQFSLRELDYIQKKIDNIEEQIFLKKEKEMVERISIVSRDVIEFGRSIKPHQRILNSFSEAAFKIFGNEEYKDYFLEILNEYFNLLNLFESTEETINSLQETNDSLVSIKSNDEMRIISIIAFTTFPLMLLSSIFSMNTYYMPIIGYEGDFWIIIGLMIIGVSIMYTIFKNKKWI